MSRDYQSNQPKQVETTKAISQSPQTDQSTLDTSLTPANILRLQSLLGNRAVQRLIQRNGEDDVNALSSAEASAALSWHEDQSDRYQTSVIRQIQERVSRPATGQFTADDMQAIARWQGQHMAGVRGMATPTGHADSLTLSAMFPNGLASQSEAQAFAQGMANLEQNWDVIGNADNRYRYLQTLVEDRLISAGVPMTNFGQTVVTQQGSAAAQFEANSWQITFFRPSAALGSSRTSALDQDQPDHNDMGWLVEQAYHEARHAEQSYMVARYLAGQNWLPDLIERRLLLPRSVVEQAIREPLDPHSVEAAMARGWYESTVGSDRAQTEAVYTEMEDAVQDQAQLREQDQTQNTPESLEQRWQGYQRMQTAQTAYESLPEEADAYRTGGMARQEFTLGSLARDGRD